MSNPGPIDYRPLAAIVAMALVRAWPSISARLFRPPTDERGRSLGPAVWQVPRPKPGPNRAVQLGRAYGLWRVSRR
jgi:hypothetical protein